MYYYKDLIKKFLNLTTDGKATDNKAKDSNAPNENKNSFLKALPEWRKKCIPGKDIIERDGKVYYYCPYHKNDSLGYPDGLYIYSYCPDQHEEFVAARKAGKLFKIDAVSTSTPN